MSITCELCPHHSVRGWDIHGAVRMVKELPLPKIKHIIGCTDDSLLRRGLVKLYAERTFPGGALVTSEYEDSSLIEHYRMTYEKFGLVYGEVRVA